eukprot:tig00020723_g13457.t1
MDQVRIARAEEEDAKARKHEAKKNDAEARIADVQASSEFGASGPGAVIDKMKEAVGMSEEQKLMKEAEHQAADAEKHLLREQQLRSKAPGTDADVS